MAPRKIAPAESEDTVLVVGSGPAGLEAVHALGRRGYRVLLAEAGTETGGRLLWESRLPGLSTWMRVRDYRMSQILGLSNVEIYYDSELTAEEILSFGVPNIVLATGASWRRDGVGQARLGPLVGPHEGNVYTPDEVALVKPLPDGPLVVFDDDCFYLGSSVAEKLALDGRDVTLVTPAPEAAAWTVNTLEQKKIQTRLLKLGVKIMPHLVVDEIATADVRLKCVFTGAARSLDAAGVVMITERTSNDSLYHSLVGQPEAMKAAGIRTVARIGDCFAPATVAHAVYQGHKLAREFATGDAGDTPFLREMVTLPEVIRKG